MRIRTESPWFAFLIVAAVAILWWFLPPVLPAFLDLPYSGVEERGQFGDSFGSVNSLFTGLAFAILIWTALLQRKELSFQRRELSLQREELHATREVLRGQSETLDLQRFESTFFQMLQSNAELVSALRFGRNSREYVGFAAARSMEEEVFHYVEESHMGNTNCPVSDLDGIVFHASHQVLGRYRYLFRHIFRIMAFVDAAGIQQGEKHDYVDLFVFQLGPSVSVLTGMYLLQTAFPGELTLVEKYGTLRFADCRISFRQGTFDFSSNSNREIDPRAFRDPRIDPTESVPDGSARQPRQ